MSRHPPSPDHQSAHKPGKPPDEAASPAGTDDALSQHERQVHRRNYSGEGPAEEGYVNVPPGEEGLYGLRRDGATEPWYNDQAVGSHSADESDSRWDGKHGKESFDDWRRKQTSPGTNVGAPDSNPSKDK